MTNKWELEVTNGLGGGVLFPRPTVRSRSVWRAFGDGFGGGLIAGFLYCCLMACCDPAGLPLAGMRVLALSLIFGGFEIWRVTQSPTPGRLRRCALWTFVASLLALWALGVFISTAPGVYRETPAFLNRVGLRAFRNHPSDLNHANKHNCNREHQQDVDESGDRIRRS